MRDLNIIVGAGKLGGYVANSLSLKGEDVVVIDKQKQRLDYLPITYSGLVSYGDGTSISVLEKNNINSCKCMMVFTDSDNSNILIGHIAKVLYGVPNVVIRLNDYTKIDLVEKCGIKVISPFGLSIELLDKIFSGGK